jgi:hypothetical protein
LVEKMVDGRFSPAQLKTVICMIPSGDSPVGSEVTSLSVIYPLNKPTLRRREAITAIAVIAIAIVLRATLAIMLTKHGFFIGQAVDSFLRTERV